MAAFKTRLKVLGALMALPFGAGFLTGRYGGPIVNWWRCGGRNKASSAGLQQVEEEKEKGRLEEEMEELEEQREGPELDTKEEAEKESEEGKASAGN